MLRKTAYEGGFVLRMSFLTSVLTLVNRCWDDRWKFLYPARNSAQRNTTRNECNRSPMTVRAIVVYGSFRRVVSRTRGCLLERVARDRIDFERAGCEILHRVIGRMRNRERPPGAERDINIDFPSRDTFFQTECRTSIPLSQPNYYKT